MLKDNGLGLCQIAFNRKVQNICENIFKKLSSLHSLAELTQGRRTTTKRSVTGCWSLLAVLPGRADALFMHWCLREDCTHLNKLAKTNETVSSQRPRVFLWQDSLLIQLGLCKILN